jgi:predicted nucleotidyltransferase component of viral defense system
VITEARIRTLARQQAVTAGLAEKNYVNSWILYAIYTSSLADQVVFKGGTALSKLYFPELWRFSEDLDFTVTEPASDLCQQQLETVLQDIAPQSGIDFVVTSFHTAGDPVEYAQVKVQYDAVLGQKNTTELDITFNEPLVFPVADHQHAFEDIPAFTVTAYSVEEIFVEKLRSLYQRARARDYYDLYRLLEQESFDDQQIANALREKSQPHGANLALEDGIPADDIDAVRAYWERGLDRLVREKPPFDEVVERINQYLHTLAAASN